MVELRRKRAIADRAAINETIAALAQQHAPESPALRAAVLETLKQAMADGRAEVLRRLESDGNGDACVAGNCFLMDQVIRAAYDFATGTVYRVSNPSAAEKLALVAVGGYGRGELAPHSDVDLLFLLPWKQTPWSEQVIEFLLYLLWDLRLKVGHATRNVDECVRLAKGDLSISTALLESRYLWGDQPLFLDLKEKYEQEVLAANGAGPDYVEAKLGERDARHEKMGDSRYVLEPNIKDGKGGLRDLHTLFWIGKFLYRADQVRELVGHGVLTQQEYRSFFKAQKFLRTVRCHLHYLTNRPEERLTFDVQPELARRLGYTDHAGTQGVERFMKHYYLVAKEVGDLTRIFCAVLEEQHKRKRLLRIPRLGLRKREVDGFAVDGDRVTLLSESDFKTDPVKMIRLFQVAHERDLDVHPSALKQITRNLRRIDARLREDPDANGSFMDILASRKDPEIALRRMNEAGVFGRFIPDFGRVVAQMQHDMYHVYTVDEHTIRAIGILAKIENGLYAEDHPLAAEIVHKVKQRRVLYLAVLLHDIAKGRGGDHSELGADVADELAPRLGLDPQETDTVSWLVRYHLAMSNTAFKRDIGDPKTIRDFVDLVQSPERLRLLLILTVADIRAVGPGVWNGWKGQLLRDLYYRAEEAMLGGEAALGARQRVAALHEELRAGLSAWPAETVERHFARGADSFWLSADTETHLRWAALMRQADEAGTPLTVDTRALDFESVTEVTIYTSDHPGLFMRLAGAISLSGASIIDARIFTTNDGMALDVFFIQDAEGRPVSQPAALKRLNERIQGALSGAYRVREALSKKSDQFPARAHVFRVEPLVLIDNEASGTHTVIEVNGRDRPGLLHDLTRALFELSLSISHARISTYGERAVDVFYVKDMFGLKVTGDSKQARIRERLLKALSSGLGAPAEAAE